MTDSEKLLHADDFKAEPLFDYERLMDLASSHNATYLAGDPFPHIVIDDFISPEQVDRLLKDFPMPSDRINKDDESETLDDGTLAQHRKHWLSMEIRAGLSIRRLYWEINSAKFINFIQALTGVGNVIPDPYRAGGGLHETRAGGMLMVHADYNRQPETDLDRRINIIIYMNNNWQSEWGGNLELWDRDMTRCVKEVEPIAGRAVIFHTGTYTFHGHPKPLKCPEDQARKSISTFYYTNGKPEEEGNVPHMTIWKKTPDE